MTPEWEIPGPNRSTRRALTMRSRKGPTIMGGSPALSQYRAKRQSFLLPDGRVAGETAGSGALLVPRTGQKEKERGFSSADMCRLASVAAPKTKTERPA
jgi:hypothetical protein